MIHSPELMAQAFLEKSKAAAEVIIVPHVRADGDAIGSGLALLKALNKAGFKARLFLDETVPVQNRFTPGSEEAQVFEEKMLPEGPYLLFMIDCHEASRLERRAVLYERAQSVLIIDHHLYKAEPDAASWIEPLRSSTAEMIWLFVKALEKAAAKPLLDKEMAENLIMGIYSDTGGLRYSNSGSDTYTAMADLIGYDINIAYISEQLFAQRPLTQLRARGVSFTGAVQEENGRLLWYYFTPEDLEKTGSSEEELGNICSELREVRGTDLALFLKNGTEGGKRVIRVNIRSSEAVDSQVLAVRLGGGGHARAAGASYPVTGTEEEAVQAILSEARRLLHSTEV